MFDQYAIAVLRLDHVAVAVLISLAGRDYGINDRRTFIDLQAVFTVMQIDRMSIETWASDTGAMRIGAVDLDAIDRRGPVGAIRGDSEYTWANDSYIADDDVGGSDLNAAVDFTVLYEGTGRPDRYVAAGDG